jgi:hypothetical protein
VSIQIRRFQPDDIPAIDRLNARLIAGGVSDRVYRESPTTPAESRGDPISQELYLATDGSEVRGGVWLHEHQFVHRGETFRAGWLKYPVSESLVNRDYGGVPGAMIVSMMRRQPQIMALGMGGRTTPFAQLLTALGWGIVDVPFFVAPVRTTRVFGSLPQLRGSPLLRMGTKVAARTGVLAAAGLPIRLLQRLTSALFLHGVDARPVDAFDDWTTRIWTLARDHYGFLARRDADMLNRFYASYTRLTRLRVTKGGRDIGWVCVTLTQAGARAASREFGDLQVGMLADGMSHPSDAATVLAAGCRALIGAGADLLVTNQMYPSWQRPLRYLGFVKRPTNFLFAYSKPMGARVAAELASGDVFLNRGDCDGPPR